MKPGSDPLAYLGEPPKETGGNWDAPWGHRCWWQAFWGACPITRTLVLANAILESSFQPISTRGLPAHQWSGTNLGSLGLHSQPCQNLALSTMGQQLPHGSGPGSQPGQRPVPPMSIPTIVSPATTEGPTQPTQGELLEYIALATREQCAAGPHRTSPT